MHMPALRLGCFFLAAALFGTYTLPSAAANKTRKFLWEAHKTCAWMRKEGTDTSNWVEIEAKKTPSFLISIHPQIELPTAKVARVRYSKAKPSRPASAT